MVVHTVVITAKPATVRYGAYAMQVTEGRLVGEIRLQLSSQWSIPVDAVATVKHPHRGDIPTDVGVYDTYRLRAGDVLHFHRKP